MKFEQRSQYSGYLNREMYFNVYGHAGKPVIVFPSSEGTKDDYADYGMIDSIREFIDKGKIKVYTPSTIDSESWFSNSNQEHMAYMHNLYENYIIHELVPLIKYENDYDFGYIATGCSMGGFHSINFALKHPDIFDITIALSGVYDARFFTKSWDICRDMYYNSPIDYLSNMSDSWFFDRFRRNVFVISTGQGPWEESHIIETQRLEEIFRMKQIPAWFDYWGEDVAHDWPWWRKQIYHFMKNLEINGKI